ncbi:MAG: putative DNA binding domain-containing protein [Bacteroidales bacterium]|nr:putative DNA binding domain-containing protein [Bacteroidales bacterium]
MTEQEIKAYIKQNFPYENESCDWKNYANLKNTLCGHEGDDVVSYVSALSNVNGGALVIGVEDKTLDIIGIQDFANYTPESAKYRIVEKCRNLNSENLEILPLFAEDSHKTVWIVNVPKHSPRLPVYAHNKAWQRIGDSLVEMTQERREAILSEIVVEEDWSSAIIEDATIDDLDSDAIEKAKKEFAKRNPHKVDEMQIWDDITFLNKAKLTIRGKITRTALMLLGKEESEFLLNPFVAKIRWSLRSLGSNENKDYDVFSMPLLLSVDKLYNKIRNVKYRLVRPDSLFPDEMLRYDMFNIREPLNNAIAHQDYTKRARIEVVEFEDDHLVFQNAGTFLPKSVEDVINKDCPESIYRNTFLVEAMRNLNMVETEGGGIKKMFQKQKIRFFPMPEYDLSNNLVKVEIIGKVVDEEFAKLLTKNPQLSLSDILLLDKVQKRKVLNDGEIAYLRKKGFIEGRKPNFFLSENVVKPIDNKKLKADYIKNRNFDDSHYKDMILNYIKKYKKASKSDISNLIIDKLSPVLSDKQKQSKVSNLLSSLRIDGKIECVNRFWVIKKN